MPNNLRKFAVLGCLLVCKTSVWHYVFGFKDRVSVHGRTKIQPGNIELYSAGKERERFFPAFVLLRSFGLVLDGCRWLCLCRA